MRETKSQLYSPGRKVLPGEFAFFFLIEFVTILLLFVRLFSCFGYLGHKIGSLATR